MEVILSLGALLLFYFILAEVLKNPTGKTSRLKLPPGPTPLPLIGNMHQLFSSQPLHHLLRDLAKKYGPLMHLKLGETSTIIVSSPEIAKEIYKTNDVLFASRPSHHIAFKIASYNFTDLAFSPHGNYWRQLRKICTVELLSSKRVQTFKSVREDEVFNVIKSISFQKGSIINLSKVLFSLSYSITSHIAFGKRNNTIERFLQLVDEISRLASGFSLADMYPSVKLLGKMSSMRYKMEIVHKKSDELLEIILNDHKEKIKGAKQELFGEAKKDLVDVLLNIQKHGDFEPQLTDTNIKAVSKTQTRQILKLCTSRIASFISAHFDF